MKFHFGRSIPVLLLFMMAAPGCSKSPSGPKPFPTFPVTGIVQVDGEPAVGVSITFHPAADSQTIKTSPGAVTTEGGKFVATTYKSGDGLPAGVYTLTFEWFPLELSLGKPVDRLGKAYSDFKKSEHKVTVTEGKPTDAGVIELSTKASGKAKK